MQTNNFKNPLLQSAALVAAVVVLILVIGSSGTSSTGGGVVAFFAGIGNAILFAIGMSISIALSITILIGIFLAAVAMFDKDEATKMYQGLKKNFDACLLALSCSSCNNVAVGATEEEYAAMKEELAQLQGKNSRLQTNVDSMLSDNTDLHTNMTSLETDNNALKTKIADLSGTVEDLQVAETKIKEMLSQLSEKFENDNDEQLKDQLSQLEQLQEKAKKDLEDIGKRLTEVEANFTQPPTPGIFTYIEEGSDQALFIEKIEEAIIL
ncbi:MAG: hypothetical protein COA36_07190, partial [Desulfotalea sp.]